MNMQGRRILLCAILVAACGTPVFSQEVPVAPGNSAGLSDASLPDLSGMWAHPFLTGFEPPASGPGPVTNTSRRPDGVANFQRLVGNYANPILKPEAAKIVKQHGELSLAGVGYQTPSNQCWPGGVPYVFWDFIVQILQQPNEVTLIYRHGNEVRHVRMNQPHSTKITPSWYGESVGHYEGDTLVIDTVGQKAGPFAMLDMYGTPFTEKLHVVERYRLIDYTEARGALERNAKENSQAAGGAVWDTNHRGKYLQLHFTVEDEGVFTMPWTATITYWPNLGEWTDLICAENTHEYYNNTDSRVPTADKPNF
jgi:hypothetical protein